ncbi:MAG: PAS domain S-box protein, partial [Chthoniobacterales bacterium]|nr:PAS domain S-box protein [Chthoniobacterales bacterium]
MKKHSSIRNLFRLIYGAGAFLLMALAVSVALLFANQGKLISSQKIRLESERLVNELRMSSDTLTHFARAYAVTADPEFENYYWQVLAIRNGQQERPEDYAGTYWDLAAATDKSSRGLTAPAPLHNLMRDVGFTDEEFAKLRSAQEDSDALVKTEEDAMQAVKGVYRDSSGKFSIHGEPDRAMATRILFDQTYYRQKARIMRSIDDCRVLLNARTAALTEHYQTTGSRYLAVAMGCLAVLFILMPVSFAVVRRRIGAPIDALHGQTQLVANDLERLAQLIRKISQGEATEHFKTEAQPLLSGSGDEIGQLVGMQNNMIARLQESGVAIAQVTLELGRAHQALQRESASRELAAQKLAEGKSFIEVVLNNVPLGVVACDVEGTWTLQNRAARLLHGLHEDVESSLKADGRAAHLGLYNAEGSRLLESHELPLSRALQGESVQGLEIVVAPKGKPRRTSLVSAQAILNSEGKVVGAVLIEQDITERKLGEKALQEAEEKYRSIFENSNDGIFQNTPEGRFLSVNPALARMLGFESPEDLIGARGDIEREGYVDPALRQKFKDALELHGVIAGFEYEVYRKDGTKIWVSENARIVPDAEGRPLYYEGRVQDITDRKRTEARVLESKRFLQSTLDALSSHIAILDQHGNIIEVNDAWNHFGNANQARRRQRGVGDNYLDLCDRATGPFSEEAPAMAAGIRAVMAGENDSFELEYPCHGPQEKRWFIARVTRFDYASQIRLVVAHENISARKRAEAKMREAGEKLEGIINSVEGIVWAADASTAKVQFVSSKAEEILGYPLTAWLEETGFWRQHLHPDDRARVIASSSEALAQLRPVELEYRMVAADGREVWFRDRTSFVSQKGEATMQRGLMIDITA